MYEADKHTFSMGCLFLALLLAVMYWIATPSRSQVPQPCPPSDAMADTLQRQYGETVTAGGVLGERQYMYITTNPLTGSFSILATRPDGTACIVLSGKGFALADPAKMKGSGL